MKKILLLILVASAVNSIKAQIPDYFGGNPKWYCTFEAFDDWATEENPYLNHTTYYLNGDTVIGGQTYHKVFQKGFNDYYHTPEEVDVVFDEPARGRRYIRQEGRTIRYYDTSRETDSLLFDYNLGVGDTIAALSGLCLSHNDTIEKIDSILVGGEYRRKLNADNNAVTIFLEGIGQGHENEFEPIFFECGYTGESFGFHCYGRNNQREWGYQDCILTVSTKEEKKEKFGVKVYSNAEDIMIEWSSNITDQITSVELFNLQGKMIYQSLDTVNEISTENLPEGIYLLKIESKEQILVSEKVWVH